MKTKLALVTLAALIIGGTWYKVASIMEGNRAAENLSKTIQISSDMLHGKITQLESERLLAALRRDDTSVSTAERLAGIEYQLTLQRAEVEEQTRLLQRLLAERAR